MVEISRSPVPSSWLSNAFSSGVGSDCRLAPAGGQRAAQRGAALADELGLGRVLGRLVERDVADLLVGQLELEAVAEGQQRRLVHLLLLMGDVLALAGLAHPVALDRLGQDHGRRAVVLGRGLVGGVDLALVEPAAVERPDLLVGHVGDHRPQLRRDAEEVLAHVGAVAGLVGLVVAVERLVHAREQVALVVGREERVPARAPDHLDDVPAVAAEVRLELLDDLAVAAHRAVEPLQVAVDDEDQVVEVLTAGHRDRAQRLRLVHLAVAHERPHLAPGGLGQAAALQVLHEARLVDRHQRAEAHRDRRELPEVRHQPRVRVLEEARRRRPPCGTCASAPR